MAYLSRCMAVFLASWSTYHSGTADLIEAVDVRSILLRFFWKQPATILVPIWFQNLGVLQYGYIPIGQVCSVYHRQFLVYCAIIQLRRMILVDKRSWRRWERASSGFYPTGNMSRWHVKRD